MEQLSTSIVNYGNGIYAIDQQMVRAFVIVGSKKALLLDTGAVRVDFLSYVKQITELPVEVFLTHGDGDHIANLPDFSDAFMNENDMDTVRSHNDCKEVSLHPVSEGDAFDLGGRKLTVLFTPGHTSGSSCILDKENKILFSGDTVSYGPIFMFGNRRDLTAYIESLNRLKKLKDEGIFSAVYCCHNECPISPDTIDDLLACAIGIQNKSIQGVAASLPMPTDGEVLIGKYGTCGILFQ